MILEDLYDEDKSYHPAFSILYVIKELRISAV